jgi:hypothetical protein
MPPRDASEETGPDTDGEGSDVAPREGAAADAQAMDGGLSDGTDGASNSGDASIQDSGNAGDDGSVDASPPVDASAPTFVQVTSATPSAAVSTASATFSQAQGAGDLVVLVIGWGGTASLTGVSDSAGNGYATTIVPPTHISAGITQAIYYAKGIGASQAGANTVTVTLDSTATPLDLRAVEYAGLDPVSPYDVGFAWGGRATTATSTAVNTTTARELVFGAGITVGSFTGAGSAFTLRKLTGGGIGVVEDRVVWSTGSYSADAPLATSSSYIMQVATFR